LHGEGAVIQDVDDTLKALLVQTVPIDPIEGIDVKFEMPSKEWSATLTRPTINLFLYDVRENREFRSSNRTLARSEDNTTGVVSRAPVRMDLSYLISVWTTDVADEHQLLGRVLQALLRSPLLPEDILKGAMQAQPLSVEAWVAQPERLPNPWEFWGHMDHGMKASLNYVITTSWQPFADENVQLVTRPKINLPTSVPR
jgi:Pvc16 N-terminal domain